MTLPAAAARAPAAIDRYLLPAPRLRQAADVDRRDRQTDGRTHDRYTGPAPHTKRVASNTAACVIHTTNIMCKYFSKISLKM